MPKKTVEDLEAESSKLRSAAYDWSNSDVAAQREEAWEYYYGELYGDEQEGRSDIVTREVYDAVEWIKPELMRIFCSGEEVVEFSPQNPDDVDQAKQETDYLNYVFYRQNPGFKIVLDWITDGLLQKNGVVKWYWDDSVELSEEVYTNMTLDEATFYAEMHPDMSLESFQVTEEEVDGIVIEGTEAVFSVRKNRPQARVMNVPPEEFVISREARCIASADYVAHRKEVTRSEVLEMGFTEKQLDGISFGAHSNSEDAPERLSRHKFDSTDEFHWHDSGDESQRKAWLWEEYWRSDIDGSGRARMIKAFSIDGKILEWEEAIERPFSSIAPLSLPHKYHGLSLHDLLRDIQRMKSSLTRAMLDNAQFANHSRWGVVDTQVNIDDLLDSRPGGVVRMKSAGAVQEFPGTSLDPNTFGLFDYLDGMAEARSGVSKGSQGLDSNVLRSNVAASTVSQTMTAAMQKRELMARIIAETGFKDLFRGLHGLVKRHETEESYVELRGEFVKVDPTRWRDRYDLTVCVGLGNGNREAQLQSYLQMTQVMQMAGAAAPQLFDAQTIYDWLQKGFELHGYKSGQRYAVNPANVPPPEPEPDLDMLELQQKAQSDAAKLAETQRHNQAVEEIQEGELIRKTLKDEEDIANDRMELQIEKEQGRPVGIG